MSFFGNVAESLSEIFTGESNHYMMSASEAEGLPVEVTHIPRPTYQVEQQTEQSHLKRQQKAREERMRQRNEEKTQDNKLNKQQQAIVSEYEESSKLRPVIMHGPNATRKKRDVKVEPVVLTEEEKKDIQDRDDAIRQTYEREQKERIEKDEREQRARQEAETRAIDEQKAEYSEKDRANKETIALEQKQNEAVINKKVVESETDEEEESKEPSTTTPELMPFLETTNKYDVSRAKLIEILRKGNFKQKEGASYEELANRASFAAQVAMHSPL